MRWIKTLYNRFEKWWLHKRLTTQFAMLNATYPHLTNRRADRKHCLALLEFIDKIPLDDYTPLKGSSHHVNLMFNNLDKLIRLTKDTSIRIMNGHPIPQKWLPETTEEYDCSIEMLLVTRDGFYMPFKESILDFQETSKQFCILMQKTETETVGVYEHYGRVLNRLLKDIRNLSYTIIELTLESDQ